MGRSCRCVVLLLAVLSFFAFSATALADDPDPLTVSASSTRETCTIGSVTTLDYNIVGGVPPYQVTVDGREIEQHSKPNYIPCRTSEFWWPLEELGDGNTQHIVVMVSDGIGARAHAIAKLRLVPALPAPTYLQVTSGVLGTSEANLSAVWRVPYVPGDQRTKDFAVRWRVFGTREWGVEHRRGEERPVFSFRDTWEIDAPPTGEQREMQVAQLRHILDLQSPGALRWSATTLVTTAAHPHELQAEATHDAITLSWGPHAAGLAYVATLNSVQLGIYEDSKRLRLTSGPLFQARFEDLLPDTLYRVSVYLDEEGGWGYRLDQHSFEIRIEPAPDGWLPPSGLATDIQAVYVEGEIEITWMPPELGALYDTRVCVSPSYYLNFHTWNCTVVGPGESRARLSPQYYDWYGGSSEVRVSVQTLPARSATRRIHIPTYEPNLPTRGDPPAAPQFVGMYWFHRPGNPAPGNWTFKQEVALGGRMELLWRVGDRWFYREYRVSAYDEGQFNIPTKAGVWPESIRYRVLRDGIWTPWSSPIDAPDLTSSLQISSVVEYPDHIEVQWEPPGTGGDVFDYRLYVTRNDAPEEKIDLGPATHATVAIRHGDERYTFRVAALTDDHGEVIDSYSWDYNRQPFGVSLSAQFSACPPARDDYLLVGWRISGGVPPFSLSIGDLLGHETENRSGSLVVSCSTDEGGGLQGISGGVMDAVGQTASDVLGPDEIAAHAIEEGESPFDINFSARNVHRDRVWLTWEDCRLRYVAALRWRPLGTEQWTWVLDFPVNHHAYRWRCTGMFDGLAPLTTYEYQLARYIGTEQLRRPEHLRWSESQMVTTLGPPQEHSILRDGDTVIVSWRRQPEAWAYVVGLRADGRSWWKRYEPSGGSTETVYFYRVPQGLELEVELVSPPLKHGQEELPLEIDPHWSYGH